MESRSTFGVDFLIRKCKSEKSKALVYVRITVNKERAEISLKEKINTTDWDAAGEVVKGKSVAVKKFKIIWGM